MIDRMKRRANLDYQFTIHTNGHLRLTVAGAVTESPTRDELDEMYRLFTRFVDQFNWYDIIDHANMRFRMCQLQLLTPTSAAQRPLRDAVSMSPFDHECGTSRL